MMLRSGLPKPKILACRTLAMFSSGQFSPLSRNAFLFVFLFPLAASAQGVDNTVSFRSINSDHYWRFNYENDFFTKTDRDYTQGVLLEWVNPRLRRFPLSGLLWRPKNSMVDYGISIEDDTYTPNLYDKTAIQFGDRPFADALFLKTFLIAKNGDRKERVSTQLSTGLIGPAAGGQGMQQSIHRWLHDEQPHGWPNQIRNDIVLNYQVNYEREFYNYKEHLSLATFNSIRLGTLSDKLTTGLTSMLGNFYSPFRTGGQVPAKRIQYYVYDQLSLNAVGYDATLQGGLFDRSNPYTVPTGEINRVTLQNRYGVVLVLKGAYFEYYQTSLTQEFRPSVFHRTGGIQAGFGF
jgi:lipid A 3-O-deacylase